MMYLTQLSVSGFKSFAKKGELEFSSPITAIVGPNGSGKSNVAEAFRFVLGEQSPSRMRGKKGEDLIWGGTDQVSRANRASVTLTLNNETRVFPVDFDEITLERTVHRDGQNEYSINGSKVRLKDVQEMLAAANIGPSGHHIISQGEADRILAATPKERREMIEDALGLKVYQYKKAEAEKKLAKTKENIERVESLRREVAPHLKYLEREMKKMERAAKLRTEVQAAYAEYLHREDVYLTHQYEALTNARHKPATQLEQLKKEHATAKEKLEAAEQDQKRDELVAAESALQAAREAHQELLRQSGQIEGQISFITKRIEAAQQNAAKQSQTTVAYDKIASVVSEVERTVEKLQSEDDVPRLRRALTDIVHTFKSFLSRVEHEGAVDTSADEAERSELESQKAAIDTELAQAADTMQKKQEAYDSIRSAIESDASEGRDAEREMFRIVGEQRECEAELNRIDNELSVIERDRDEFKRELQEAVTLIGRGANEYLNHTITDSQGNTLSADDIVAKDRAEQRNRRRELEKMKIRLEELGGTNEDTEKEYKEVKERDEFLAREIEDLEASVQKLEQLIAELTEELNALFATGIEKIGAEFNRFFTLMFGGGSAKLVRVQPKPKKKEVDEEGESDETEEAEMPQDGIELDVALPNKRVRGLDMLSGGERALTSIALIFAMSQVNPPLFIILDETDAALDEANSRRYGDMIEALAQHSQLILITHNRETMRRAGILYGVTMHGDGVSKLLSVKFEDALVNAK